MRRYVSIQSMLDQIAKEDDPAKASRWTRKFMETVDAIPGESWGPDWPEVPPLVDPEPEGGAILDKWRTRYVEHDPKAPGQCAKVLQLGGEIYLTFYPTAQNAINPGPGTRFHLVDGRWIAYNHADVTEHLQFVQPDATIEFPED